jgi:acylphosphatase
MAATLAYRGAVVRYRVLVSGRVQGVFFRDTCRKMAEQYGVSGWVRNRPDGRVEAVFEGSEEAVRALLEWARHGPPSSVVENVSAQGEPAEGLSGFLVTA